jgi:DNA repair exonuclease SbcCD nuclease subunit
MVTGSKTAAGQPLRNCDFSLGLEDLAFLRCDHIALGHIHKAQEWSWTGTRRYCGSPFHTDWGDWADKSFTIWEYDSEGIHGVTTEALPAHQMLDLKTDFHADEGSITFDMVNMPLADPLDCKNSEFRLTYSFNPEESTAAHIAAKKWRDDMLRFGAADVKLNPQVIVTTSARIPEVTTAIAPADKLKAYMRSRGEDPEADDNQRVLEKFARLVNGDNHDSDNA